MCRIAGIISKNRNPDEVYQKVKAMCDNMNHGGPDDEGMYLNEEQGICFGHRRLSILDLSAAGHQPMSASDDQIWIIYNGEIYNFQEIRTELVGFGHVFKSGTDTEVILKAYLQWGTASFSRFNGMFAFALADLTKGLVYLVRDAVGIKPLYYHISDEELIFASELKAFKQFRADWKPYSDWKFLLLAFGHIPEPYTTLNQVYALAKGSFLTFNLSEQSHSITSYRKIGFTEARILKKEYATQVIKEKLKQAVRRHLIADAPIGLFLSGGIDSSVLTLLAADEVKDQLHTLSVTFSESGFSEKKYQQEIIERVQCRHQFYQLSSTDLETNLDQLMDAYDQPSNDAINSWFVSKYAKEAGLKAVLSGLGSDEVFGGYPSFSRIQLLLKLQKFPQIIRNAVQWFPNAQLKRLAWLNIQGTTGLYLALRGCFSPKELASFFSISCKEVLNRMRAYSFQPQEDVEDNAMACWLEFNRYMQNQLLKDSDYMSMQHGLELRVPFLDQDFLDAVFTIDRSLLYQHGGLPKQLLIDAFKEILPVSIWNRPKMGFSFPLQYWLGKNEQIRQTLQQTETGKNILQQFNKNKLHWSKLWTFFLSQRFEA